MGKEEFARKVELPNSTSYRKERKLVVPPSTRVIPPKHNYITYNMDGMKYSKYLDLQKIISDNSKEIKHLIRGNDEKKSSHLNIDNKYSRLAFRRSIRSLESMIGNLDTLSMRDLVNKNELLLASLVELLNKDKEVKSYLYMKNDNVMTSISVRLGGKIHFVNFTDRPLDCAFGFKESPVGLSALLDLLEERCVPKNRFNIEEVLLGLGLSEYNEVDIVEKTYGILVDDSYWIKDSNDTVTFKEALNKVGLGDLKSY